MDLLLLEQLHDQLMLLFASNPNVLDSKKGLNPPDRCLFAEVSTLVPSEQALLVKVHDLLTDLLCLARRGHIHDQLLCILLENSRGSNGINSTRSSMACGTGSRRSSTLSF